MNADVRGRAAYLAYRAGADLARVTPPAIGSVVAGGLSRMMTVAWPTRRAQVERNLQRVTGGTLQAAELDRMVSEVFSNYARYWHEFFRLQDASRDWILEHCVIEGVEHIDAALDAGRGGILALPHLGNWDMAGATCAALGLPMTAVAEPVEPPELFDWFVASRQRIGLEVIPLGPHAGAEVTRALAANRIVCLLCDRDLVGNGVAVDFFGETTTVPSGPATLALRTGARLLPCASFLAADGFHVGRVAPAIPAEREGRLRADVQRVTEALVRQMEEFIRAAPEQWLLMQPNWPSDRDPAVASDQ
jgi:KDO2-lipid IV(A) lauroyltransferase